MVGSPTTHSKGVENHINPSPSTSSMGGGSSALTWLLVWASLLKATTTVLVGSSGFAIELSNSNQMGEWAIGKKDGGVRG